MLHIPLSTLERCPNNVSLLVLNTDHVRRDVRGKNEIWGAIYTHQIQPTYPRCPKHHLSSCQYLSLLSNNYVGPKTDTHTNTVRPNYYATATTTNHSYDSKHKPLKPLSLAE